MFKGGLNAIFKNGNVYADDLRANPTVFSGKSVDETAQALMDSGCDIAIRDSAKKDSEAKIIKIINPGNGKNISQVQVSPGGRRHGKNPYIKFSATDQGIIKVIDGYEKDYKTDGKEKAILIFTKQ